MKPILGMAVPGAEGISRRWGYFTTVSVALANLISGFLHPFCRSGHQSLTEPKQAFNSCTLRERQL
jgi:hypothetical protein